MALRKRIIFPLIIYFIVLFCIFGSAGEEATQTDVCNDCHSPDPPPPESTTSALTCNTCHNSGSTTTGLDPVPFDPDHLASVSSIPFDSEHVTPLDGCNQCHPAGSTSSYTSIGTALGIPVDPSHYTTVADTCSDCHTTSSPTDSYTSIGTAPGIPVSHDSTIITTGCSDCHASVPTSTSLGTAPGISIIHDSTITTTCSDCHTTSSPTDSYTSIGTAPGLPLDHDTTISEICSDCHVSGSSGSTVPGISPAHGATINTQFGGCGECHNADSSTASSIWLDPSHLNPFDSTCTASGCHDTTSPIEMNFKSISPSCGSCHPSPASADISIQTTLEREWYLRGEMITYLFTVDNTGLVPLHNVLIHADVCSEEPQFDEGDTDGDTLLDPDEEWIFRCMADPAWVSPDPLVNHARVTGGIMGEMEASSLGDASLYPFTLDKNVINYSGEDTEWAGSFTVRVSKKDAGDSYVFLQSFSFSESAPLDLWLTEGEYKFEEIDLPQGFLPVSPLEITIPGTTSATFTNTLWYGCSPGYWKNHANAWPTGYTTQTQISTIFSNTGPYTSKTLSQTLSLKGGKSVNGAKEILLRAGTAAVLNDARFGDDYPTYLDIVSLKNEVNGILARGDRTTMLALATDLEKWNSGYCPS